MALPTLLIGGSQGSIYTPSDDTADDADGASELPIATLVVSNIIAPAGPQGECIFPMLHLTTVRTDAVDIDITLIVDQARRQTRTLSLAAPSGSDPLVEVSEIDLSDAYPAPPATAKVRHAPRGSAAQVELLTAGRCEITVMQLEYDIVRESRRSAV